MLRGVPRPWLLGLCLCVDLNVLASLLLRLSPLRTQQARSVLLKEFKLLRAYLRRWPVAEYFPRDVQTLFNN